jgi:prepilin-type N-terminal cleavage/methylation domain-containing protein
MKPSTFPSLASRRRAARGYTVVEVLSAMALFAIGAAGVISMQKVTIQGGDDARRFDVATNIANEWAARLQRDSMFWTLPNAASPLKSNLVSEARNKYLQIIDTKENQWVNPAVPEADSADMDSPAYDLLGRELPSGEPPEIVHMFCVQYRLQWIAKQDVDMTPGALIRAEVRVVWARLNEPAIGKCSTLDAPAPDRHHFVYVTTAIRQNPSQ